MGASFVLRALLCFFISGMLVATAEDKKMIACYFTNWSQYRTGVGSFKTEHIDPHLCTHLFFAFAKINETRNTIEHIEWNYDTVLHPGILKLKQANPKLKLILSVGGYNAALSGWTSASQMGNVNTFANNVVSYLRRDQFDGVDIDWEVPDQTTKSGYFRLMKALRSAIDKEQVGNGEERLLLITDVAANKNKVQYYSPYQLAKVVDYVIVMAYDFYGSWSEVIGHHSPLFLQDKEPADSFFSQHQGVEMWRQSGVPLDKLVLGLAAYGRSMLLTSTSVHRPGDRFTGKYPAGAPYTKEAGFYAYYEACNFVKQGVWTEVYMPNARVPYVYGTLNTQAVWIGYDNPKSITEKSVYAVSRGMAGVMLWALDFDDFTGTVCGNGKYPLLKAINTVFDKAPKCSADKDCELEGVKGVCVAGFCGCAQGSYISNKNFCTGKELPAVSPGVYPSTSLDDDSHAARCLANVAWLSALSFVSVFIVVVQF
ncbi:chitinase-3-like protein 1 [Littorina saxatilis]|uniref:GH18 domain-containing protein n=1 Tax=Littorina saxatilis TaxID=31220 RepID=A0AAN9BXH8_9CAEN